MPEGQF